MAMEIKLFDHDPEFSAAFMQIVVDGTRLHGAVLIAGVPPERSSILRYTSGVGSPLSTLVSMYLP